MEAPAVRDGPHACSMCGHVGLESGWLVLWNGYIGQKVRWQPEKPGYVRLRVSSESRIVLAAGTLGKGSPPAWRCSSCGAVVVVPRLETKTDNRD